MDGPPAQSLGVEPVDKKILNAKPRKADDPIVTRALLLRAITSAALIVAVTLRVFKTELEDGKVSRRDTTMTFMTFVNCDLVNSYCCRSAERCCYELSPTSNPAFLWAVGGSIVGQLLIVFWSPLQEVFQTEALNFGDMTHILFLSSSVLVLDSIRKKFFLSFFSDGFNVSPAIYRNSRSIARTTSWLRFGSKGKAEYKHWSSRGSKARTTLAL
jgi:P-type Ca2+ transporter type 2C